MPLKRYHISEGEALAREIAAAAVGTEELKDNAVTKAKVNPTSIQFGATSVSLPFAAAGIETVTADITFPTAFAAEPSVVIISCSNSDMSVGVSAKTATGFTVAATDTGTDYTAAVTVTIYWMAVE